jgi:hypothetical protein
MIHFCRYPVELHELCVSEYYEERLLKVLATAATTPEEITSA